jgi:hypothetical protein
MTDKYWQKEVINSKFNAESKFGIKNDRVDFRCFRNLELPIFILIRFWEIRSFLTNGLRESACIQSDFESYADILTSGRTPQ